MKATLHITVDAILLEKAKTYAAEKKVSISQLVEDYLRRITEKPSKLSLLDIIDNLPKSTTDFPANFDFKKGITKIERKSMALVLQCCRLNKEIFNFADVSVFINIDNVGLENDRNFVGENTNKGGKNILL